VKGIPTDGQLTDINPLEAEVKRAMIRQSERPVLLVDGRKFEQRGFSIITHVSEVSQVITADTRQSYVEALEDLGVDVQSV
jgi:DeoR family transcriptional regulator of aga operon